MAAIELQRQNRVICRNAKKKKKGLLSINSHHSPVFPNKSAMQHYNWFCPLRLTAFYFAVAAAAVASVVSDSVRPHRQQPTRLPCPLDSPGKNTGVGCHFLLQCMKVKSESEVAQSCPTLRSPPGSSIHGIFQARVLEWVLQYFSTIAFSAFYSTVLQIESTGEATFVSTLLASSLSVLSVTPLQPICEFRWRGFRVERTLSRN